MKYTYQLWGDSHIFSSRKKAHLALCKFLNKNEDAFLPYKEKIGTYKTWTEIHYPNGNLIIKRPLR